MIVELAQELGLNPKKTTSSQYNSACPACATGQDRFCLWPKKGRCGRFWCRQCGISGDSIDFCKRFFGLDYPSACRKLEIDRFSLSYYPAQEKSYFNIAERPSGDWKTQAQTFVRKCHANLLKSPFALEVVRNRGLALDTVKHFQIGWNPSNQSMKRESWGLPFELNNQGKPKEVWLPEGLLIPTFSEESIIKLKVRRQAWHNKDTLPKYVEISGSMKCPAWFGYSSEKPILLVEAELDAILIQQFAEDLCCCMAIGGAGKHPDVESDRKLKKSPLLLFAFDFDEAGKTAYSFWKSNYSHVKPWPVPLEKSPADAFLKANLDLRKWIENGINSA